SQQWTTETGDDGRPLIPRSLEATTRFPEGMRPFPRGRSSRTPSTRLRQSFVRLFWRAKVFGRKRQVDSRQSIVCQNHAAIRRQRRLPLLLHPCLLLARYVGQKRLQGLSATKGHPPKSPRRAILETWKKYVTSAPAP